MEIKPTETTEVVTEETEVVTEETEVVTEETEQDFSKSQTGY
jgi:hypothetical protein